MTIVWVLVTTLLISNNASAGFDSSDAFNTITFSYVDNAYVSQTFNLSSNQQTSTSFTLSVDAKDGGGRPTHELDGTPSTYSSQYDTAKIQLIGKKADGSTAFTSTATQNLMNWGSSSNPGWSTSPGDNQHDWTTMELTVQGDMTYVETIEVRLISIEGSYWAGNYGVQFRAPTLTQGTGTTNLLYNPEFGASSSGTTAQGWTPSYSSYSSCGTTSGNRICTTNESNVTANMSDTTNGEDSSGGTSNGQAGGYSGQLTTSTADSAEEGNGYTDSSGGGTTQSPAATCGGSSDSSVTCDQASRSDLQYYSNHTNRKSDWEDIDTGTENIVRIEQVGDDNDITITQTQGYGNGGNLVQGRTTTSDTATILGEETELDISQYGNDNVIGLDIDGDRNDIGVIQSGNGMRNRNIVEGSDNYLFVYQSGNFSQTQGKGHFADVKQAGDDNFASLYQWDENQLLVVDVNADNTMVIADQRDGENYASIVIGNDYTSVALSQKGGGDHGANVYLTGTNPTDLDITQNSSTSQIVDVTNQCASSSGCTISITQD